jgi:hypothetical protein
VHGHFNATVMTPWRTANALPQVQASTGVGDGDGDGDGDMLYGGQGEAQGGGTYDKTGVAVGGEESPVPIPPDTLDECWDDPSWGDYFRQWAEDKPVGNDSKFCRAVEQDFVPSPSWSSALAIFATHLDDEAADRPFLNPDTVEEIRSHLPGTDADFDTPPDGNLFLDCHTESAATLIAWYDTFKAAMAAPAEVQ